MSGETTINNLTPSPSNDHDLLIELKTEMRGVRSDIGKLGDTTIKRLGDLEITKADQKELDRVVVEAALIHKDQEDRLRRLETRVWLAMGALVFIQFLAPFALKYITSIAQ